MSTMLSMASVVDAEHIFKTEDLKKFWYGFKDSSDFDQESFFQLFEDTNEDTTLRILARFQENLADAIQKLTDAMKSEDCEVIWKASHKLAGSSELLGFRKFGGRSRELSVDVRANLVYSAHAEELKDYLEQTLNLHSKIKSFCPSLSSYL